jgi:hypothetical protein
VSGQGKGFRPSTNPHCELSENNEEELLKALHVSDSLGKILPSGSKNTIRFSWPLRWVLQDQNPGKSYFGLSNYVDLNPAFPAVRDFQCGGRTYNVPGYAHQGTDLYLWPGWWKMMDAEEVDVVAAAKGILILKNDGQFDRQCQFNSNPWNVVYIRHSDSLVTWYGHLKKNSVTTKAVGDSIQEGEYLGKVGSSGNSTGPHLHFEVRLGSNRVDPYAGSCNPGRPSLWKEQHPYFNRSLIRSFFTSGEPEFPNCPLVENLKEDSLYEQGDSVYFTNYYRDLVHLDTTIMVLRNPIGQVVDSFVDIHDLGEFAFWDAGGWIWKWGASAFPIPGRYEATSRYKGKVMKAAFWYAANPVGSSKKGIGALKAISAHPEGIFLQGFTRDEIPALQVLDVLGRNQHVDFVPWQNGWLGLGLPNTGWFCLRGSRDGITRPFRR